MLVTRIVPAADRGHTPCGAEIEPILHRTGRLLWRVRHGLLVLPLVLSLGVVDGAAQQGFARGQNIAPAYEGWEQNDDGSFNLVFGYMNRNWEEIIDLPIGGDNQIEPGDPDQGQPTHFYPRRNRFVFSIRVPADFGDKELVWTLTSNGQTERAYATLKPDYYIDNAVIQANYGAGGAAGTRPDLPDNVAPVLTLEGEHTRTARVGQPSDAGGGRGRRRSAAGDSAALGPTSVFRGVSPPRAPPDCGSPGSCTGVTARSASSRSRPRSGKIRGTVRTLPGRQAGARPNRPRTAAG